jgi:hypothetical protein
MLTFKEAVIDVLKEINKGSTSNEVIDYVYRRYPDKP